MARVVCVHGVGQQREAAETLHVMWAPALCGGVGLAGGRLAEAEVRCAFYGDLFRPPGRQLAAGDPLIRAEDLDQFERELLGGWWGEAACTDAAVVAPDARTLAGRAPRSVQGALRALSGSRFFAALGERALLGDLRQVRDYFQEPGIRQQARQRVNEAVGEDTRVLVGHSLGSVVAYEAMAANPGWPVRMLVTLGSPLGIPNLILDRLEPEPLPAADARPGPRGRWPGKGREWVNVADQGDVVALVKDLRLAFGPGVDCWVVDNGATAHDARPYLTAMETGRAIWKGVDSGPGIGTGLRRGLMEARGGNRFLLTAAVTRYPRDRGLDRPELASDVERVAGLLARDFGYTHLRLPGDSPTQAQLRDGLRSFCRAPERRPDDLVAVYLACHGEILEPDGFVLLPSDIDPDDRLPLAVKPRDLIEWLLRDTRVQRLLLMLDACYSGQGGQEAAQAACAGCTSPAPPMVPGSSWLLPPIPGSRPCRVSSPGPSNVPSGSLPPAGTPSQTFRWMRWWGSLTLTPISRPARWWPAMCSACPVGHRRSCLTPGTGRR